MKPADFDTYLKRHRLLTRVTWYGLLGFSVGIGLLIGFVWTFAVGIPAAVVVAGLSLSAQLRISKALWVRRFPELASKDISWRRTRP